MMIRIIKTSWISDSLLSGGCDCCVSLCSYTSLLSQKSDEILHRISYTTFAIEIFYRERISFKTFHSINKNNIFFLIHCIMVAENQICIQFGNHSRNLFQKWYPSSWVENIFWLNHLESKRYLGMKRIHSKELIWEILSKILLLVF